MLLATALVMVVDLTVFELPPALEYLVYGGFFGAMGGNEIIVRRERREGEMPPDRVRRISRLSVVLGVLIGALAVAVQVALALL